MDALKKTGLIPGILILVSVLAAGDPPDLGATRPLPCLDKITGKDALLVGDPHGQIIFKKNISKKCVPASTLKLLTALTAIHHLKSSYRFPTRFYMDPFQNLKMKGFGDPLLVSEVLKDTADALACKVRMFKDLITDDTFFSSPIKIPGRHHSTNPYDASLGALCANFNTVFFASDSNGRIVSAEPQTPMIPFARQKIRGLGSKGGRYTFSHDPGDAARYVGELLLRFLKERHVQVGGDIRAGAVSPGDKHIYTYWSRHSLDQTLARMLEFSNNFMANQILISMGAWVYGPPGTLAKGVKVVSDFASNGLHLKDIQVVEGSGICRKNRLSAMDMFVILRHFEGYRHLLKRKGNVLYKTGSLRGVRTRAGYIETDTDGPYPFVIFMNNAETDLDALVACIRRTLALDMHN
jgi:D-alanyl-D-alanine carboxypeptidase/D-alanyl-D-alanine-endopeptidase (penicillin-binding protein 4)